MMTLLNKTNHQVLIPRLEEAKGFWSRGKGLLGRESLPDGHALWIHHCNSIHTYFMKFSIDCVFVDRNMKVRALFQDVRPGRLILPVWKAKSVIEMPAGTIKRQQIQVGDELYVGT